jgi:hypothetical protein
MIPTNDGTCQNCKYWQNYSDRIMADVTGHQGPSGRGLEELRRCRYVPPPTVRDALSVYTDRANRCSGYEYAHPLPRP